MNTHCGGCRARAFGMTGDLMAEDPLCTHTPGTFAGSPFLVASASRQAGAPQATATRSIEYGIESPPTVEWDDAAARRAHEEDPGVRPRHGVRAVEESCRKNGIGRVTAEELERIRARMPTPKLFG